MKRLVWVLFAIILVQSVSATFISDYPTIFFSDKQFNAVVIRSLAQPSAERLAANMVIHDLQRHAQRYGLTPSAIKTSAWRGRGNEIVIGTPCGTTRVRQLLNITPQDCRTAFDHGLLKVIDDVQGRHLVIAGAYSDQVLDAAKVLVDERQRTKLKVVEAKVVRKVYRKYYIIGGSKGFLDIGQTIGAETPALYTGYPYVTYRPINTYRGTNYGAIVNPETRRQRLYYRRS